MKRVLVLAAGAGMLSAGCAWFDRQPPVTAPTLNTAAPPPIRAADVTPQNAYEKARALNDELDRDLESDSP